MQDGHNVGQARGLHTCADLWLMSQVVRMLRLTSADIEVVTALQAMHAEAKADNYGHMFRSPTLWEDMVKSITLCNCG